MFQKNTHEALTDLEGPSIGVCHCTEALAFTGEEHTAILAAIRPQIHSTTVPTITVKTTVIHLYCNTQLACYDDTCTKVYRHWRG